MNVIDIKLAVEKLKDGLPVVFQTDTLPAIGCLPNFPNKIYEIKKRDFNKPLILMGAHNKQLIDYVHNSAREDFDDIASRFWPGALTIVLPISKKNKSVATSKDFTIGLRVPNSNIAKALLIKTGPLLTSSANISGAPGSITAQGIALDFPGLDILGPVPWEKCNGRGSTIISWIRKGEWKLIREGPVSMKGLQ